MITRAYNYFRDEFINPIIQSEFAINAITLISGTALSQFITVLITPFITRLYTPEDMGQWSLFMAVVNLIIPCSAGSYEQSVVLPKTDDEARQLLKLMGLPFKN